MLYTMKRIPTSVRRAVYARDGYACVICNSVGAIHLHHIQKRSQGGKSAPSNLVCLCPTCHAIVHGECELKNQFPFDKDTAMDALLWYMYEGLTIDYAQQRYMERRENRIQESHYIFPIELF